MLPSPIPQLGCTKEKCIGCEEFKCLTVPKSSMEVTCDQCISCTAERSQLQDNMIMAHCTNKHGRSGIMNEIIISDRACPWFKPK